MQGVADIEGADRAGEADPVPVDLALGVAQGVERGGHPADLRDADIVGEQGVQGLEELGLVEAEPGFEACRLSESVDAGVRPSGPDDRDVRPGQAGEGFFDGALDRAPPRLFLPAVIIRAVVAQDDEVILHGNPVLFEPKVAQGRARIQSLNCPGDSTKMGPA